MVMVSKSRCPENIASLKDCTEALLYACENRAHLESSVAAKQMEKICKITRQFEKVLLAATVATSYLSLNLFISSVCLLGSSGAFFLVPLIFSAGTTLLAIDLVTVKVLTERIKKVARELHEVETNNPAEDSQPVLIGKSLKNLKLIQYAFDDLLVLPNVSSIEFFSFKQCLSFLVLKHINKLALGQEIPSNTAEESVTEKAFS